MEILPRDTTPEALAVQVEAFRRLGEAGRFRLMMDMCDWGRELAAAGVRLRHPQYTPEQVQLAVARIILGERLFAKACPGVEVAP